MEKDQIRGMLSLKKKKRKTMSRFVRKKEIIKCTSNTCLSTGTQLTYNS